MKNFKHLRFFILIVFSLLLVFVSFSVAQEGWFSLSTGSQYGHSDVFFVSADTGYIAAEMGRILITPDGGKRWMEIDMNSNSRPNDLFFLNSRIGWVAADNMRIFKTIDGGRSWKLCIEDPGSQAYLLSVYFVNEAVGYAVGWKYDASSGFSTLILKTTNGGLNWEFQTAGSQDFKLSSVYFMNENTGWIVGEKGYIFKTANGGTTWIAQNSNTLAYLYSVYFYNDTIGWAVGFGGVILKTTDGGNNWILQNSPASGTLFSVFFLNDNIGYACGHNGTILKTTNGGLDWTQQVSGTTQGLVDLYFISPDTGYVVGWERTILKTVNGGVGGTKVINNSERHFLNTMQLNQNYPNPFNPKTTIKFFIPHSDYITLVVYNSVGKGVTELYNGRMPSGFHTIEWNAENFPSGVYYYKLAAKTQSITKKLLLIK